MSRPSRPRLVLSHAPYVPRADIFAGQARGDHVPKRPKRRPVRRRPQDRTEELTAQNRYMDNVARGMIDGKTVDQLRSELHDRELILLEADRAAQMDPSGMNLAQYRAARSQVEAARRAVAMAANASPAGPAEA